MSQTMVDGNAVLGLLRQRGAMRAARLCELAELTHERVYAALVSLESAGAVELLEPWAGRLWAVV